MSSPPPTKTGTTNDVATSDPDVAHDWLQAVYVDYEPEESNNRRDFRFRGTLAQLGRSSVSRLQYSMSADNYLAPSDVLLVLQPTDGVMKVSVGRHEEVVPPGMSVLFPPRRAPVHRPSADVPGARQALGRRGAAPGRRGAARS
jgi:hypothetical protein